MPQSAVDDQIDLARNRRVPTCPTNLEARVLRRIRSSNSETPLSFLSWLIHCLPQPAFVASVVAFAIITSALVSLTSSRALAEDDRQAELRRTFGFESISQPPTLPICNCQPAAKNPK